ncbi:MAG: hypothetical protein ABI831_01890 [Betaproteobacteria bacterium]
MSGEVALELGTDVIAQLPGVFKTGPPPVQLKTLLLKVSNWPFGQSGKESVTCSAWADGWNASTDMKPITLSTHSNVLFRMLGNSWKMPMVYNDVRSIPAIIVMWVSEHKGNYLPFAVLDQKGNKKAGLSARLF